jgi:hypothetical protein
MRAVSNSAALWTISSTFIVKFDQPVTEDFNFTPFRVAEMWLIIGKRGTYFNFQRLDDKN